MKNSKWNTKSEDNRSMNVVLFVSRRKDNKDIPGYKERRKSFITKESVDSPKLKNEFKNFVNEGIASETSRMYYSINERDEAKIYKDLLHFLIDTPDFNLCSISSKLAGIAAINNNAKTKHWMFDFDIDNENAMRKFYDDIKSIDDDVVINVHKTPHGYAIVTNRGFDTRELFKMWSKSDVTLKRDDLLCVDWATKKGEINMTDDMVKELKKAIFDAGVNAIEDLIGCELEFNTDEDMMRAMDETLAQMPDDVILDFYNKYCKP